MLTSGKLRLPKIGDVPVRQSRRCRLSRMAVRSGQSADLTMEMHDFGTPVPITAPATNEVVDLLQALSGNS